MLTMSLSYVCYFWHALASLDYSLYLQNFFPSCLWSPSPGSLSASLVVPSQSPLLILLLAFQSFISGSLFLFCTVPLSDLIYTIDFKPNTYADDASILDVVFPLAYWKCKSSLRYSTGQLKCNMCKRDFFLFPGFFPSVLFTTMADDPPSSLP